MRSMKRSPYRSALLGGSLARSTIRSKRLASIAVACCLVGANLSVSAHSLTHRQEYASLIRSSHEAFDVEKGFGEILDRYTGQLSMEVVDVSLPGAGPTVEFRRRLEVNAFDPKAYYFNQYPAAQWDIAVPYIHGIYGSTEVRPGGPGSPFTCSSVAYYHKPPAIRGIQGHEYWSGIHLYVPGQGSTPLLLRSSDNPGPIGYQYVTSNDFHLTCSGHVDNASGTGYKAVDSSGTTYYFEWLGAYKAVIAMRPATPYEALYQGRQNFSAPREEVRLYPTKIIDRFGNWVTYKWTGGQLTEILASDQRSIVMHYIEGRLDRVVAGTRQWAFEYANVGNATNPFYVLTRVVNPDQSDWRFSVYQGWYAEFSYYDRSIDPNTTCNANGYWCTGRFVMDKLARCAWMRRRLNSVHEFSVTAPSGVTASYAFRAVRHPRTDVPYRCMDHGGDRPDWYSSYLEEPMYFDTESLVRKVVSGAGVPSLTWTYDYEEGPAPKFRDATLDTASTKTVSVQGPSRTMHYEFGRSLAGSEGMLLKESITDYHSADKVTSYEYVTAAEAASQNFAPTRGQSLTLAIPRDSYIRPLKATQTILDDVQFTWRVDSTCGPQASSYCFDNFARATKVSRSSGAPP